MRRGESPFVALLGERGQFKMSGEIIRPAFDRSLPTIDARGQRVIDIAEGTFGGFALVAWPAAYDNSGVMTFMISHDGVLYQKDLGPDGAKIAKAMKEFNPDSTWQKVTPPAPEGAPAAPAGPS